MAAFSSRGPVGSPASDDIIKPDVTALGADPGRQFAYSDPGSAG